MSDANATTPKPSVDPFCPWCLGTDAHHLANRRLGVACPCGAIPFDFDVFAAECKRRGLHASVLVPLPPHLPPTVQVSWGVGGEWCRTGHGDTLSDAVRDAMSREPCVFEKLPPPRPLPTMEECNKLVTATAGALLDDATREEMTCHLRGSPAWREVFPSRPEGIGTL